MPDGLANSLGQRLIVGARAEDCTQVGLFGRKKAGTQLSVSGQADAVASRTEWFADGVDKSNLANTITKGIATGGFRGITCGDGNEGAIGVFNDGFNFAAAKDILFPPDLV